MIKTMKKLKLWSIKKKKKKSSFIEHPPPSCHYHHHWHYHSVEPSAPPLSSWLEYDQTHDTVLDSDQFASTTSAMSSSSQAPFTAQDDKVPQLLRTQNSTLHNDINGECISHQQYMEENPVYGVPVVPPQVGNGRDARAFGCVLSFGAHLFGCFFPCFHIREAK